MGLRFKIAAIAVAIASSGCTGDNAPCDAGFAFKKEVNFPDGKSQMVVLLDTDAISIVESVQLELIIRYAAGNEFSLPSFRPKLGQWTVVDESKIEMDSLGDGRIEARRRYKLEPYLPGSYVIPETPIKFEGVEEEVLMPEIPVTVSSVLDGGAEAAKDTDLKPAFKDVAVPGASDGKSVMLWIVGGLILILIVIRGVSYCRAGGQKIQPQPAETDMLAAELEEVLGGEEISASKLSSIAIRTRGVSKELVGRIETLAFSESGSGQQALRDAAIELQKALAGKGGQG